MTSFAQALDTSCWLAEKVASAPCADLRERQAMADFLTFGLFKHANLDPQALSTLQRGLGWGVGLGLPALGVGHLLLRDAHNQADHLGKGLIRDARNQALLTAAGVGGMQALGEAVKGHFQQPAPAAAPAYGGYGMPLDSSQRLAAAIMYDDLLEDGCRQLPEAGVKHAMLVGLIRHRVESTQLLRELLR